MNHLRLFCYPCHIYESVMLAWGNTDQEARELIEKAFWERYKQAPTVDIFPFEIFEIEIPSEPKVEIIET